MKKTIIGFIIALVVVGASSFYGGMLYAKSKSGAQNLSAAQRQGFGGNGGGGAQRNVAGQARGGNKMAGGGFVNGDIIARDAQSITVQLPGGGSKIIFLSGSSQISKFVAGGAADLEIGKTVMVNGAANSDGSITAQIIQLRL